MTTTIPQTVSTIPGSGGGGGSTGTTVWPPGLYAAPPGSPSDGDLYPCTDSPLWRRYASGAWISMLPGEVAIATPPLAASFAWIAPAGTSAANNTAGHMEFAAQQAAVPTMRLLAEAYTAPFGRRVLVRASGGGVSAQLGSCGTMLWDGTKFMTSHHQGSTRYLSQWSALPAVYVSSPINQLASGQQCEWLTFYDDGANLNFYQGPDNELIHTQTYAAHMTPTHWGFFGYAYPNALPDQARMRVLHSEAFAP